MQIRMISEELKKQYGSKVLKLSLSSGCTCPNRDGTIGYGGCTFCSEGGSGEFAAPPVKIQEQIRQARERVDSKFPRSLPQEDYRYIAYFQSFTNTYGDTQRLKRLYKETLEDPRIVILSVGTRPDCLEEEKVRMLSWLQQESGKQVWVELGLQTIHEQTARRIHRGYPLQVFEDTYRHLKEAGLTVVVHIILGLPGETKEQMLETVRYVGNLFENNSPEGLRMPVDVMQDGVKLQLLHILKGTQMEREFREHPFHIMEMEEYADLVVECLQQLPPQTIIHRLTGDPPRRLLVAPLWSTNKKRVLNLLREKVAERP